MVIAAGRIEVEDQDGVVSSLAEFANAMESRGWVSEKYLDTERWHLPQVQFEFGCIYFRRKGESDILEALFRFSLGESRQPPTLSRLTEFVSDVMEEIAARWEPTT